MNEIRRLFEAVSTRELHFLNWMNPFYYLAIPIIFCIFVLVLIGGVIWYKLKLRKLVNDLYWYYCLWVVKYDSDWCREVYRNVHKRPYDRHPELRAKIVREVVHMRLRNIRKRKNK